MKKAEGRRKISGVALLVCLAVVVNFLVFVGRPTALPGKNRNTVQAADSTGQPDLTGQPAPAPVKRKQTASVVIGRLGYVLFDDGTATVTDETGAAAGLKAKAADITIPSHISYQGKRYTVTAIGQKCFSDGKMGRQNYGRIVLPDTIRTIEMGAFYEVSCEELVIPDSVTTIEEYAFYDMTVKKDFYYPAGATEKIGRAHV